MSDDAHATDPLPPGWTRQFSKSNQKYFYHHKESAVTQWHFPTASEAKNPAVAKQRAEQAKEREQKRSATASAASKDNGTSGTTTTTSIQQNDSNKRPRYNTTGTSTTGSASATAAKTSSSVDGNDAEWTMADRTSVAVIVPYRDLHAAQKRAAHLQAFVPHMLSFFQGNIKGASTKSPPISNYHVYIIEQSNDGLKFNRGKLLNIGFDLARKSGRNHDVYIFHDVDLLPGPDLMHWYTKFPQTPIHIARVWDRYSNNPKYFGGVVSFSSSDYKRINGVRIETGPQCVLAWCYM
jgi:N-terminal region of glycosyl transferase group 7/WW domain/N-terminal domain of galactosyltransferase